MSIHAQDGRTCRSPCPHLHSRICLQYQRTNSSPFPLAARQAQRAGVCTRSLARPLNVAVYEPDRHATYLAATLSFGIINGHPLFDGNKRTAFFLANEYLRAQGFPGLVDEGKIGKVYEGLVDIADRHINAAAGKLDVEGLARGLGSKQLKS